MPEYEKNRIVFIIETIRIDGQNLTENNTGEIIMDISISTLALSPKPLDNVLECLDDRGLKYCEVINEYPYNSIDQDVVDSIILKYLYTPHYQT